MGSMWTVPVGAANVDRVELEFRGDPFWVELKQELSTGERNRIRTAAIKSYSRRTDDDAATADASTMDINVNMDAALYEKVRVWLADWSLADDKGNKLQRTIEVFRALRGGVFDLIEKAVDAHAKAVEDQEKKVSETSAATPVSEPTKISA